jgi:uncharacterized protein YpmS
MPEIWRTLVVVSLALNAVLVICVAVLLTRDTASPSVVADAARRADVATKTAGQALQLAVNEQNTSNSLQTVPDELTQVISEQTTLHAQLTALCAWAEGPYPPPKAGSELDRLLKQLDQQACVLQR